MSLVIPLAQVTEKLRLNPADYIVFGGTFDPFHAGHVAAIKEALKYFRRIFIAPTTQNPWKQEQPTPLAQRIEMIKLVLAQENILISDKIQRNGVCIINQPYIFSEELVTDLRSKVYGTLFWLVGEDSRESVINWRNWDKLGVTTIVAPVVINTHSTLARTGKEALHPAIAEYALTRGLYKSK